MSLYLILGFVLTASLAAVGQGGFVATIPDQPVDLSQVNSTFAWVRGHSIALDKKSELPGPSTSEISCDRKSRKCYDTTANIMVTGNDFAMSGGHDEYEVERWDDKEIVASNVGGICRVRNVIKFDLVQKRVYALQTLSEPVDDLPKGIRDSCKLVGLNLELKDSTMWRKQ